MSKINKNDLKSLNTRPETEDRDYVKVGMSTCGLAAGSEEVYETFLAEIQKRRLPVDVCKCGCLGMCYAEPLVEIRTVGLPVVRYGRVTKEIAVRIVERHLMEKIMINDYIYDFKYTEAKTA